MNTGTPHQKTPVPYKSKRLPLTRILWMLILVVSSSIDSHAQTLQQLLTGERPSAILAVIYDPSPSTTGLAVDRTKLTQEGLRVIRQSIMNGQIPRFFIEHYLPGSYPQTIRKTLLTAGVYHYPGPGNDIYLIQTLLNRCSDHSGQPAPSNRVDSIRCGPYARGLTAEAVALGLLPRFLDNPSNNRDGLFLRAGVKPTFEYNTFTGDPSTAEEAWKRLKTVPNRFQEHTTGSLLTALDELQKELDRARNTGRWLVTMCDPVHVVVVSDFAYTSDEFAQISQKIQSFQQRYSAPVYIHALIYPNALRKNTIDRVGAYITNPGKGKILDWVAMFRDPYTALSRAVGRSIQGPCWFIPGPTRTDAVNRIDPATYTFYLFGARYPESVGWTGGIPRTRLKSRPIPDYDPTACFDQDPRTPCGTLLPTDYLFDTSADDTPFTDWTQRHIWLANPVGVHPRTCRALSTGDLADCDDTNVAQYMGLDRFYLRRLVRFLLGDPATEIDHPSGLFRDRCKFPDDPTYDCLHKTSPTYPIITFDQTRILWTPWSSLDQFPFVGPPADFYRHVSRTSPAYLFLSTPVGLKTIRIPFDHTAQAREVWTFVPYQTQKHLFPDALPGSSMTLPPKLIGFRMGTGTYLIGLYRGDGDDGFFVFRFDRPSTIPSGPETSYLFDTTQRWPGETFGILSDVKPVFGTRPSIIFGSGYRSLPYREVCFYHLNFESSRVPERVCHLPGPKVRGTAALSLYNGEAWFAVDTVDGLVIYRISLFPHLRIKGYWFISLSPAFFHNRRLPARPARLTVTSRVINLIGPRYTIRRPYRASYAISINRLTLEKLPSGSTFEITPENPHQTFAYAHREGPTTPTYTIYHVNRGWYPCGQTPCDAWGLIFENTRFVRLLARVGSDLDRRLFLLLRTPECFKPIYFVVSLWDFWFRSPVPFHHETTKHSYAYDVSPFDGHVTGLIGYGFPGPVTGIIPPHGTFNDLLIIFADSERNGQTTAVRLPHVFAYGTFFRFSSPKSR